MRHLFPLAALLLAGAGAATPVAAQPKPTAAPACGVKVLPLVLGTTWTYTAVKAPTEPPKDILRQIPPRPHQIVISVTAIETKGTDTVVKLTEKNTYDLAKTGEPPKIIDQVIESTITCSTKGKFEISPNSFFFAGEPGGFRGLVFDKFDRKKETSWKLTNGTFGETEWIEEIVAVWKTEATKDSNAKLGKGKLELERKFTPQPLENLNTKAGKFAAEKLGLTTTGRIRLDDIRAPDGKPCTQKVVPDTRPPEKSDKPEDKADKTPRMMEILVPTEICELPANWITTFWIAPNVGVVQTLNTYAHMYQLAEHKKP